MKVYNNRHFQITFILLFFPLLLFILFMFPKKRAPPGRSPKRKARKARKARTITKVRSTKSFSVAQKMHMYFFFVYTCFSIELAARLSERGGAPMVPFMAGSAFSNR